MNVGINGNRTVETRNASNLSYVYSPAGCNWLYQRGSDTRMKAAIVAQDGSRLAYTLDNAGNREQRGHREQRGQVLQNNISPSRLNPCHAH